MLFKTKQISLPPTSLRGATEQSQLPSHCDHAFSCARSNMSRFCRRSDDSPDDDENLATLSESSDPLGRPRASLTRRSRGSSLGSLSCSASEHPTLIDYPTLPVPVNVIPTVRSDQSQHSASQPDPMPVPLVRDILRSVPSLDMSNEENLQLKFTYKR